MLKFLFVRNGMSFSWKPLICSFHLLNDHTNYQKVKIKDVMVSIKVFHLENFFKFN